MASLPQVLSGDLVFTSLPALDLSKSDKKEIRNYFINSYNLNESLFSCLSSEDAFYKCPDSLRLPLVFYYGHTAAVYVNKMILANLIEARERISFSMDTIFETGVDEMSWDDVEHNRMGQKYIWPSVHEVVEYRKTVRKLVLDVIDRTPLELPMTLESAWWSLLMGIEHERIHVETSSVLIRQMPISLVRCPQSWRYGPIGGNQIKNELVQIDGSIVKLGRTANVPFYGWDNEFGEARMEVPSFETSKFLITNGEFLEFVLADGYKRRELWSSEGWSWVTFQQARHPTFWVCDKSCKSRCGADLRRYSHCDPSSDEEEEEEKSTFKLRCIFDVIELPLTWPVEVNYYEAKAFCAWKGNDFRLLSEAEYVSLRNQCLDGAASNLGLLFGSSTPVDFFPPNQLGIHDVTGNVWSWLEDHFNGFPGFQSHYLYDDFSTPCFDGLHNMIAGGSWSSNGVHMEKFCRFSFRRHFFQNLGFRIVRQNMEKVAKLPIRLIKASGLSIKKIDYPFIDEKLNNKCHLEESMNNHFLLETTTALKRALRDDVAGGLNELVLLKCLALIRKHLVPNDSLLHIGCATGGLTLGFKKHFRKVIGIDLFQSYIEVCRKLMSGKGDDERDGIVFRQMTWIPNELSHQNAVIFTMGDRTMNLKAWSRRMPEVLRENGILISIGRIGTGHIFTEDEDTVINWFDPIVDSSFEFEEEKICINAWMKK